MASAKAVLGRWVGRLLFKEARVVAIEGLGAQFRRIQLAGDSLRGVAWKAGDKVQLFLGDAGMRTYTPMKWSATKGSCELLAYLHGDTPGTRWARALAVQDSVQIFGPRGSVALGPEVARAVLFGDETSFALAQTLQQQLGDRKIECVFEVREPTAVPAVLQALDPSGQLAAYASVQTTTAAVERALLEALGRQPGATLVMSGNAVSIQALRKSLRALGQARKGPVKAYWAPGKVGLD